MELNRRTALSLLGAATGTALASTGTAETEPTPVERGDVRLSRDVTVAGSPVTVQGPEGVTWRLHNSPPGSDAELHDPAARTTSIRPDEPGTYSIVAETDDGEQRVRFRADARNELVDRYAPRLIFHRDTHYRPTRIEAMLDRGELRRTDDEAESPPVPGGEYPRKRLEDDPHDGETVAADPTVFDVANRDDSHYVYLPEEREEYRTYHERYPPTVYANVTRTEFRGAEYTAIVYWYFYVFDPKHSLATFFEHQADLESCIVLVDDDGPQWFGAVQHGAGEIRRWEATPTVGTHPRVFPELGAHASHLRDASRYDGDGFLIQGSHLGDDSPFSEGAETDPAFSLLHTDETGSAAVWSHDHRGDVAYQLVPLVGNEIWSTYVGGFGAAPAANTSAFQRRHYDDPGGKMRERLHPDHEHVDASGEVYDSAVVGRALTLDVGVKNWGPKPHPYWVSVLVSPPGGDDADTVLLADERFRVGTDREAFARVEADGRREGNTEETRSEITVRLPQDFEAEWDVRVQVWSYEESVRRETDFHDEQAVDVGGVAAPP